MNPYTRDQVLQELEQNFRTALGGFIGQPKTPKTAAKIRATMMMELQKVQQYYPVCFTQADLETVATLLSMPLLGLPESLDLVSRIKELPDVILFMFANNTVDTDGKLSPFHLLWVEQSRREKQILNWNLRWDEYARTVTLDVYANPQTEVTFKGNL